MDTSFLDPKRGLELLLSWGLTPTQIAERVGCRRGTLTHILRGGETGFHKADAIRLLVAERAKELERSFNSVNSKKGNK